MPAFWSYFGGAEFRRRFDQLLHVPLGALGGEAELLLHFSARDHGDRAVDAGCIAVADRVRRLADHLRDLHQGLHDAALSVISALRRLATMLSACRSRGFRHNHDRRSRRRRPSTT